MSATVQILLDTRPPFTGDNQEGIIVALEQDEIMTYCGAMSDPGIYYLYRPAGNYVTGSWNHFILHRNGNGLNADANNVRTATTISAPR